MQVDRLRLAGFKSFVEPTELVIEPGLTGIVGPNGCGKSNLVEALRWVMGEASARRLRGGEMDDVIFAGSAARPARNVAEVALTLDNAGRDAPFSFNDRDAIEVVRRIERGDGSAYRINGREARARDVQLLFADAATGAHSGGLVSQGRIGALIAAKPSERRLLLDEAAGTAGLYARRHEAELKLKAAEDNLLRLDDVIATMAQQLDGLRKQARQAQRYRRLAEQIRRTEAELFEARWRGAAADAERVAGELRDAERAVAAASEHAVSAERVRAVAEEALPPLRLGEAAAAAALHRITHAREALEQELTRSVAARQDAARRIDQLAGDIARENEHLADADAALVRLTDERRLLEHTDGDDEGTRAAASVQLDRAAADLAAAEIGLQQMTEACVTGEARRTGLERQRRELADRQARLQQRLDANERQRSTLAEATVTVEVVAEAEAAVAGAVSRVEASRDAAGETAERLTIARTEETRTVTLARQAESRLARLKAEAEALASVLTPTPASGATGDSRPMLAQLEVPPGLEAAAAALFDDELSAPILGPQPDDGSASCGWVELPPLDGAAALPEGSRPLADQISAPAALGRRLTQAGWVDSVAEGWRLQTRLAAGQSLVDRDGRQWRWDGFVRLAPDGAGTAQQLRQRNRLTAIAGEIAGAESDWQSRETSAAASRAQCEQAVTAERSVNAALRLAEERLARCRADEAELARRVLSAETRLAALAEAADKIASEIGEVAAQAAETERGLAILSDPALARVGLEGARAQATAARRREGEAHAAIDRLRQEAEARHRRLSLTESEAESWQRRRERAAAQCQVLIERQNALVEEIAELTKRPTAIAAEGEGLARASSRAAAEHRAAADALAEGETRLRGTGDSARQAEHALSQAREQRARCEVRREGAAAMLVRLRGEIGERLDLAPEALAELAARDGDGTPSDPEQLDGRLDRLIRERDAIGPVNLVAEREAEEVEERITGLRLEHADLTEAIARLRRGIGALDQEGRKRLAVAFDRLNRHFSDLFVRLFGGGKAHLAFTDDGDPLDAGIEILASPPGKRLQALSLLSGGEQALTAIALIFAMFLTNPAPICVLDEVDAPLDDANVDRFCRLIAETADTTGTRFLLITHHRITMAHMDRLFGVTMAERGVSQLVSVDLARATELRQTA